MVKPPRKETSAHHSPPTDIESVVKPAEAPSGYRQFCPMAAALDEVGQRWCLLILRDLARTPLRFSDFQAINPSLSPTVLTARLRRLETVGLIERRRTRTPSRTVLYTLAETARPVVGAVLTALVDLGAHLLEQGPPLEDPAETLAEQMRLNSHFVIARGLDFDGYFVFDAGGWKTHVIITENDFIASAAPPEGREPDAAALFLPPTTMVRIMGRVFSASDAEKRGLLHIEGNRDLMLEFLKLLSFADPTA